ncbi:MAG: alpha-E domain-containing protein [Chromatiales bacterium]|nr:alpha-E domain-containing protein [Chromatiales bacterium]
MLSRVAENIYWMARYVERAEDTARMVGVNTNLLLDLPKGIAPGWRPLIDITGCNETYEASYGDYTERQVLKFLIADQDHGGSILSALRAGRENCRTIRDIVPREAWEQINELYLYGRDELQQGMTKKGRHGYLKQIILRCQTITGMLAGTMNHDRGYEFLRMGRNMERADMTTRIIDVRSANLLTDTPDLSPFDNIQWVSVLKSLTGYQMYRQSMQVRVRRGEVLRFLFQSEVFPRSLRHALRNIEASVEHLPNNEAAQRALHRTQRAVQSTQVQGLDTQGLHRFVDEIQLGLSDIHKELATAYFLPE